MLVALPSAIAYGVAIYSLLGPDFIAHGVRAGILGAIAIGLVAGAVGGAPRLISGPCAPAAAVLVALANELLAGTHGPAAPERIAVLLALVGLIAGGLQFLYGVARGGRLIKYIPFPVVSGYLSAVGVMIFASQLPKFLGLGRAASNVAGVVSPHLWQIPAMVVGAVTIAGMLLAPKVTKALPASILGLIAGLVAYAGVAVWRPELRTLQSNHLVIGLFDSGGGIFAGITGHWTALIDLHFADWRMLLAPALTLSVLLSVDTLKTCVVVDAITRTRHDSNRTLLGQGAANLASALIGGMPGAGQMGPTLVNLESGGRTRLAGLLEGVFALLAALVLSRWIAWVPVAALAGILLVVAVRMVDWHAFQLLRQKSTMLDFAVSATVVGVAVASNLIAAAGAGVGLAIVLFLREQVRGSVIRRKIAGNRISSTQHRLPAEQAILEKHGAQTTVCELQGSLFFGTTDQLFTELAPDLQHCRYLILDLRRVQSMDFTAAHLFEQFAAVLAERNGCLVFSRLPARRDLQTYFAQVGVMKHQTHVRKFETLDDALNWVEDRIIAAELPAPSADAPPLSLGEFDLTREFDTDQTLATLASCVTERTVAAGQLVFKKDDIADELYLIRRGIVRIVLPLKDAGYHNLASFGRGHIFGEMAFLARTTRSANALATTDTELFVLSRTRFDTMFRTQPLVGVKLYARLARTLAVRLRRTDDELRAHYET